MSVESTKLVVVSNRLPVSVSKVEGKLVYTQSSGGLATGLSSVVESKDSVWIGWPGISIEDTTADERKHISEELKKRGCFPVFLTEKQINNYYSGYSNGTLWPLLHYINSKVENNPVQWDSYKKVNQLFCDTVLEHTEKDSVIWVHDYQLMKLPHLLRNKLPSAKIGFFLHTPFPSYELFRILPERLEVIEGLLGADLIGFHTHDYVRHFKSTVLRLSGLEASGNTTLYDNRQVSLEAYPIGIDYQKFVKGADELSESRENLMNQFGEGMKVILSFDRADYTKGIPERLDGYEYFLKKNPKYHKKVVMLVIIAPTRIDINAYKQLKEEIDIRISRINGTYSTIDWTPVSYIYRDLDFEETISMYVGSDIMLVTPLRDGMNLMAKEFIATKQKGRGVLILSERAGAASELIDAIQVNPTDKNMVAEAILQAIIMPQEEQKKRIKKMQERISVYTVQKWAQDFLNDLRHQGDTDQNYTKRMTAKAKTSLYKKYSKSSKRLILLDYDGTLRKFVASPDPDHAAPSKQLLAVIKKLKTTKHNKVVIISGRPKKALSKWFKNVEVSLVAEHGGWVRHLDLWTKFKVPKSNWKLLFEPILSEYVDRTPGSLLETKDFALVWHYRNVEPELAFSRSQELIQDLEHALSDLDNEIGIFEGNKIVEIKPKSLSKGEAVRSLIAEEEYDFVLAIGDDYTDEDMFDALSSDSVSIKVGAEKTNAKYRLDGVDDVLSLLSHLSKLS